MKSELGPPMMLGVAAAAQVRLIVWCKGCGRQVEPDVAAMAATYGADIPVPDWRERLVCSQCGGRDCRFRCDRSAALGPVKRVLKA
jgi:hypothetical protein